MLAEIGRAAEASLVRQRLLAREHPWAFIVRRWFRLASSIALMLLVFDVVHWDFFLGAGHRLRFVVGFATMMSLMDLIRMRRPRLPYGVVPLKKS